PGNGPVATAARRGIAPRGSLRRGSNRTRPGQRLRAAPGRQRDGQPYVDAVRGSARGFRGPGRLRAPAALAAIAPGSVPGRFPGCRSGERALGNAPAELSELIERFTQVGVAATEYRIPLCGERFGAERLAAKNKVEGCAHGFA